MRKALASYDRALTLWPDYAEALYNRGLTLHELKRFEEALASYDRALTLRPDYAEAHWNEALLRLLTGDFSRGWVNYEWRWKNKSLAPPKRNFSQPLWLGARALDGKAILLHCEQGFGDTIQFCRYVPLVAERGAYVILQTCPKATTRADEHSPPRRANHLQRRPPARFRYTLPIAQLAAGVRDAT